MRSVASSAAWRPISGVGARAESVGHLGAELQFVRNAAGIERLHVRVHCVEFDPAEALLHHAGDRVASAAADADHFDARAAQRFFFDFVFQTVVIGIHEPHDTSLTEFLHTFYCGAR